MPPVSAMPHEVPVAGNPWLSPAGPPAQSGGFAPHAWPGYGANAMPGQWLYAPISTTGLPLSSGCFVEVICSLAGFGVPDGSGIFQLTNLYQPDASGQFAEAQFLGSEDGPRAALLASLFSGGAGGAVLHVCYQVGCPATAGSRPVVHATTIRLKDPLSLTERWICPNLALSALRGNQPSSSSGGGMLALGPPPGPDLRSSGKAEEGSTEKERELKRNLKDLRKRLGHSVTDSLFERAQKRRRLPDNSDDEDGEKPVFDDAPSRRGPGNQFAALAKSAPGALLESGLTEVRRLLQARGGVNADDADALAPLMFTYFRSVWQGQHPPSESSMRNNMEMEMLAQCIDHLCNMEVAELGDALMQRFKSLQVAASHGWKVASELELGRRQDVSVVNVEELQEALRLRLRNQKLEEGLGKAKGGRG